MITLPIVLVGITLLFGLFLLLRNTLSLKVCALCGAVTLSWLVMLILFWSGQPVDSLIIGILVGTSITGLMYLLESVLPQKYKVFKLAYFLTALVLAYDVLADRAIDPAYVVLAVLWVISIVLFVHSGQGRIGAIARKVVECCKNW